MKVLIVLSLLLVAAAALPAEFPGLDDIFPTSGRIVGGNTASRAQFPYQVGLSLSKNGQSFWCGGSLISQQWVLTAAHCTQGVTKATVWLGVNKVNTLKVEAGGVKMTVSNANDIITHDKYNDKTLINDIALIKLPSKVALSEYIKIVALPARATTYSSYAGDSVVASGWGRDSDAATSITSILRFVDLTIMDQTACAKPYKKGLVQPSNICVITQGGKSTCQGDSGGPLVTRKQPNVLIGVTSFGSAGGCEKNIPSVFTRTTSYLDWIKQQTGLNV